MAGVAKFEFPKCFKQNAAFVLPFGRRSVVFPLALWDFLIRCVSSKVSIRVSGQGAEQSFTDLAVLPDARGRRAGQQMLAFVESEAKAIGACKITLEVLTGNDRARRSYEHFGFEAYTLDDTTGHALFLQKGI